MADPMLDAAPLNEILAAIDRRAATKGTPLRTLQRDVAAKGLLIAVVAVASELQRRGRDGGRDEEAVPVLALVAANAIRALDAAGIRMPDGALEWARQAGPLATEALVAQIVPGDAT